jgi:galactose mutarotase-like enzyme
MRPEVSAPPSGEQYEITHGDHHAIVTEVGATLRSYAVGEHELVDGFSIDEPSTAGRGQVLAPWPNRLEDGTYSFEGKTGRTELDEPEHGNAIHGLVRWLPWSLDQVERDAVSLVCTLGPDPAYPWQLRLTMKYRVGADGLTVTAEAENGSADAAPFGIGFHPYLTLGTPVIDDLLLEVPAGRRLLTDDRGLPMGEDDVAGSAFDLREPRRIGSIELDTGFTGLATVESRTEVRLAEPGTGHRATVWMDRRYRYVQIYTGDTLQPSDRRRRGIAIEPMTCPPNALRSGVDVIRLEPGGAWRGRWGISMEEGS